MVKILFIGGLFDKNVGEEILSNSKGVVHYAANKFQWNLIDGFLQIDNTNITILSAPFIGSYPKDYHKLAFKSRKAIYRNIECNYVSFNNIWGYKSISRKKSLIKGVEDFALEKTNDKVIFVYSPHTPFLQAAVYAKEIDPSIHICLIVPDLPQFMNLNEKRSLAYDNLKKIDISIFNKNLKYVDSFVLLTELMKNKLNIGERSYVVVEGVVNTNDFIYNNIDKSKDIKMVAYTGTLNKKFGIVDLVRAFYEIQYEDVQLMICGKGDSEDVIKDYASKDDRINYLGQLSNEDAVKLQNQATVLVNPRQNNEEFTKYSFPSKNMEYLLTGNPVIAYKLDGIPSDYDDYFYYVEDNTLETLTKTIEKVLKLPQEERIKFGDSARKYVINEKNNYKACKKIIEMIEANRSR